MARILLIDDEPTICRVLSLVLRDRGHDVEVTGSGELALEAARRRPADLALIDVNLPGMTGLEAFVALREQHPSMTAVFITAHGSIPSAIAAIRAGAFDYLTKPFDNEELVLTIDRALEVRRLADEVTRLRDEIKSRQVFPGIVGTSPGIQEVLRVLSKTAATDATVLILGESGTGKELIARSLHRQSRRSAGPFVAVNCSAIPAGLVESEFFGHERGAFTDAKEQRVGRFEQAHGGTLFLDEVGDLSLEAQAKLLRVLEEREVTRVGARRSIPVNVRVVAATNKDLEAAVGRERFREDLFWRLHVVTLQLPPLRERQEDLPLLIDYLIDRVNTELGTQIRGLGTEATSRLLAHDWPGNIRELENTLKRAMIMADGPVLQATDLPRPLSRMGGGEPAAPSPVDRPTLAEAAARASARVERALIEATLTQHRGSRTATADALGINRKTLFNKMRSYGLTEQAHDEVLE